MTPFKAIGPRIFCRPLTSPQHPPHPQQVAQQGYKCAILPRMVICGWRRLVRRCFGLPRCWSTSVPAFHLCDCGSRFAQVVAASGAVIHEWRGDFGLAITNKPLAAARKRALEISRIAPAIE
jgi:hypothetical protein